MYRCWTFALLLMFKPVLASVIAIELIGVWRRGFGPCMFVKSIHM